MKDYLNFMNENMETSGYNLYIETDESLFDENWDISINISDIWKPYEEQEIDLKKFVHRYKLRINDHKNEIIDMKGADSWNELAGILNEFNVFDNESSLHKFDEIYDWADKNSVEMNCR